MGANLLQWCIKGVFTLGFPNRVPHNAMNLLEIRAVLWSSAAVDGVPQAFDESTVQGKIGNQRRPLQGSREQWDMSLLIKKA